VLAAAAAVPQRVDIEAELANLAEEQAQLKSAVALASRNTATPTQVSTRGHLWQRASRRLM
jgi:hypothetical protein